MSLRSTFAVNLITGKLVKILGPNRAAGKDVTKDSIMHTTTTHAAPSWQSKISQTIEQHSNDVTSRYLQLASVDERGHPCCRTLVFREFNARQTQLFLHTDSRSDKISQFEANKQVEACWYFNQTREQFRLKGQIECIVHDPIHSCDATSCPATPPPQQLRNEHWQKLSGALRDSYGEDCAAGAPNPYFVLLILNIAQVDYLRLAPLPHLRLNYQLDEQANWIARVIRP
ncbi:pyridoxamine 5'-phosphate oxidase family protein [Paraglaciecola polaris]|uniref:Pyridoxamine 5'-phosphate oxidase-related, FMN-binding n=1 Tax=Paraglaciecola polaris LMG 21857 TaxID=1129793 RepID=K7AHX5_9ALTE|nr:pyridoxamine 5'-phosphate oxidase family protein [Paraglaciecola polaris]GAC34830.1 pyridoxamine 5'-phosphate oxidase-related, FMN-binding [Paraglaciecola polaris LMG 21857]